MIYRLDGQPLPAKAGGPVRFFIPDFAACHTAEIDESPTSSSSIGSS